MSLAQFEEEISKQLEIDILPFLAKHDHFEPTFGKGKNDFLSAVITHHYTLLVLL